MSEITMVLDLRDWVPRWGEFDLRYYWDDLSFVIEVDYEVGEAHEPAKPIRTKLVRFEYPVAVVQSFWPMARPLVLGPMPSHQDHARVFDLGSTALLADCRFNFRTEGVGEETELTHFYVHFVDMKQQFQVVARSVEVSDGVPPGGHD